MITQDSVLNIGEDLSMEATVEGVVPAVYQWYFNNEPIAGANHRVYNIVNAQLADAGTYRMDAFDESGKMLLSVDVAVRVIDPNAVPESGDSSLPLHGMRFVGGRCGAVGNCRCGEASLRCVGGFAGHPISERAGCASVPNFL